MVPLSQRRRHELLANAVRNDQIIIEDGYDSQLVDDAPQEALKSIDRSGRVIYVGSMSKTLAPGLRLGYIVAPADLVAELRAFRRFMLRHPPANNQRAVALFLSLGHHEALVRKLSAAFADRRKRLVQALDAFLPDWKATDPAGGASIWLEGPESMDSARLAETAATRSVLIEPGAGSSPGRASRRASCGSASRPSPCSISNRASGNWPRPQADDRPPPDMAGPCASVGWPFGLLAARAHSRRGSG